MKKIPCLFERVFDGPRNSKLTNLVTVGCEWVFEGEGTASRKWDGTACAVIEGKLYKRYDAKNGKLAPIGGIPCQEPDPVTGHWPHWIPTTPLADRWHLEAVRDGLKLEDGTYELVGPKVNGNPEGFGEHTLLRHGDTVLEVPRTQQGLCEFLMANVIEGIVFAHPDGRMCKIRRADFGMEWGNRR